MEDKLTLKELCELSRMQCKNCGSNQLDIVPDYNPISERFFTTIYCAECGELLGSIRRFFSPAMEEQWEEWKKGAEKCGESKGREQE